MMAHGSDGTGARPIDPGEGPARMGMVSCADRMGGAKTMLDLECSGLALQSGNGLAEAVDTAGIDGSLPRTGPVVPSRPMSK